MTRSWFRKLGRVISALRLPGEAMNVRSGFDDGLARLLLGLFNEERLRLALIPVRSKRRRH